MCVCVVAAKRDGQVTQAFKQDYATDRRTGSAISVSLRPYEHNMIVVMDE